MAGSVEISQDQKLRLYRLQTFVDAAYAEMGIRNTGAGRCKVRCDNTALDMFWVRVHGECASPEVFAENLRRLCRLTNVEPNGSGKYVKILI